MTRWDERIARIAFVALCISLFVAAPARGTPILVPTVTPAGPGLHYNYSITFNPSDGQIALLTVNVLANDASLTNLVAPAGFLLLYSSAAGQGFLDFLPIVNFPLTGTLSGFQFDSLRAPGPTTFDGLTTAGAPVGGVTTGPVGPTVPEPATWVLLTIGIGALGGRRLLTLRGRSHG